MMWVLVKVVGEKGVSMMLVLFLRFWWVMVFIVRWVSWLLVFRVRISGCLLCWLVSLMLVLSISGGVLFSVVWVVSVMLVVCVWKLIR